MKAQHNSFKRSAESFEHTARDITQAEVATSRAALESDAFSYINAQQAQLDNTRNLETALRQHLHNAGKM